MHLEFSEKQQAFNNNFDNVSAGDNGFKIIFTGAEEEIDALQSRVEKAKDIRDNGFLTFERAKEIING